MAKRWGCSWLWKSVTWPDNRHSAACESVPDVLIVFKLMLHNLPHLNSGSYAEKGKLLNFKMNLSNFIAVASFETKCFLQYRAKTIKTAWIIPKLHCMCHTHLSGCVRHNEDENLEYFSSTEWLCIMSVAPRTMTPHRVPYLSQTASLSSGSS